MGVNTGGDWAGGPTSQANAGLRLILTIIYHIQKARIISIDGNRSKSNSY